uniref:TERF1-interacting nuclear factor 2 N-terminal domain-containing protein n=1 Tax=Echeneis naucrates TaxID=173247 RepID=A0A665VDD1_ECHNA
MLSTEHLSLRAASGSSVAEEPPGGGDDPLPLASLRLLVPPFQLMAASMWQVLKKQDVMNYWKVAEFVSLVTDMVPELLTYKHRTQLKLGLKARVERRCLTLCCFFFFFLTNASCFFSGGLPCRVWTTI